MGLAVLLALGALGLWLIARQRELFCLSVRGGRVLVVRGRIPPGLLRDVRDVISAAGVPRATIRGVRTENGARLVASGAVSDHVAQRLRNVFGLHPVSRLVAAPPIARPTLGQVLGIAWLAWLLDRSSRT